MLKTDQNQECEDHENYQIRYICMEQLCKDNSLCCVMCIKHLHKKCDENLFVDISEISKRIEIEKSDQVEELKKNIENIFCEEFSIFFEKLKKKKEFILKGFEEPKRDLKNLTGQDILNYKQFFDISKNERKNRICVKNPIKYDEKNSVEDIKEFEYDLKKKMKIGSGFINELKFYNTLKLSSVIFQNHQNLILSQKNNGILIKKIGENQNEKNNRRGATKNYFIFSKKPLETIKLKLTMSKKYQFIPFIGLIPEGVLKKAKKSKENKIWDFYQLKDVIGVHSSFVGLRGEGSPYNLLNYEINKKTKIREDFDQFSIFFEYNKEKKNLSVFSDGNEFNVNSGELPVKRVYHFLMICQSNKNFEFDLEKLG